MRIGVRALVGCLLVGTLVAVVVVALTPRTANGRSVPPRGGGRVAALDPPAAADSTPPPPTAVPVEMTSDQDLVSSANLFLTVDLVVVSFFGLLIVLSVGWLVVQLVRGGDV